MRTCLYKSEMQLGQGILQNDYNAQKHLLFSEKFRIIICVPYEVGTDIFSKE